MNNLALKILEDVKAVGGRVELLPPDKLRVSAPPPLMEQVKVHKPEIIAYLQNNTHPADQSYQDGERAGMIMDNSHPQEWADVASAFINQPRPEKFTAVEWSQILNDAGRFLDSHWLGLAQIFGWQPETVFSIDGFITLLEGHTIMAMGDDFAFTHSLDRRQRYMLRYAALRGENNSKWRVWQAICEPAMS